MTLEIQQCCMLIKMQRDMSEKEKSDVIAEENHRANTDLYDG